MCVCVCVSVWVCFSVPPLTTVHFCFVLITYTVAFLLHTTYVPCLGPTYRGTPVLITYTVAFLLHTTYVPCLGPTYRYGECQWEGRELRSLLATYYVRTLFGSYVPVRGVPAGTAVALSLVLALASATYSTAHRERGERYVAFLLHTTYVPCLGLGSYVSNGLLVR
jgi:hypothetical protein